MKKLILLLFTVLLPLLASAQTKVEIDGIWYNLVSKVRQAEVTFKGCDYSEYYEEYSDSITIPTTVTYEGVDYSVTSIGDYAFYNNNSLTIVTIPKGVTSIGYMAFQACFNLTTINIPESMTSIGSDAFHDCQSLTTINIPEGVKSIGGGAFMFCYSLTAINIPKSVTSIGDYAFRCCNNLTTITVAEGNTIFDSRDECNAIIETSTNTLKVGCSTTIIPKSVTNIGDYAFYGFSSLAAITIPEGVVSIGYLAFSDCYSLTSINIPESVTSISNNAFWQCYSLTSVNIPNSVTSIGWGAFYACHNLTSINIPKSVTSIQSSTFYNCSSLATITIPESVTSIGYNAFSECRSLTVITIPEGVKSIEERAFSNCNNLSTIILPKSLEHINNEAFARCPELLDVYCYAENVPYAESNTFEASLPEYATLHVPNSTIASYKSAAPWNSFGTIVNLGAAITRITLDKTSATLTEGEELTFTITVTPNDVDMALISWSSSDPSVASVDAQGKVTAVAKGTATITAIANDGSGVSASCEIVVNELILGKCATPTISYEDGEVIFACDTEGVAFISETKETNGNIVGKRQDEVFSLFPTYTITAYATKENYENSDEVSLTLCWIPCTEEHESEETGILTIPSKPVLISTQGGTITLSGLAADTEVAAYDTAGTQLATAAATGDNATLTTHLTTGDIAIVKIGDYSIKIVIK